MNKLKVALYWAASCGGCEIAVVDIGAKILDVAAAADIVFWPCIMDFKYHDVEAMPDKGIDLCLFNGSIRNSEQEYLAHLLRQKSKVLVAYGTCAYLGGIPGLANLNNRAEVFQRAYRETPSTVNPERVWPQTSYQVAEGELRLPEFYDTVRTLAQVVAVDYFVPGCPPVKDQTWAVLEAVVAGKLPPPGSVVGAYEKTVCDECPRLKEEKKVRAFHRPYQLIPDPQRCLLEQGILCAGPATRGGCGTLCLKANMPCRGCYGPAPGVVDQGAKLLSAVASIIDSQDPEEVDHIIQGIPDPVGIFYLFGLPGSLLRRKRMVAALPTAEEALEAALAGARRS